MAIMEDHDDASETWESMDGDPTLILMPVYKSFKFKTSEDMERVKAEKTTNLKDDNLLIPFPKSQYREAVLKPHPDERRKASLDHELPELVGFFHDSKYQFVKDIGIDSEMPSQSKCLEENFDLDHNSGYGIITSDVESTSESMVETRDSSVSSIKTELKDISEQIFKKDVSEKSGFDNLTNEDREYFRKDSTSTDHLTKKTISETILLREDQCKADWSNPMLFSRKTRTAVMEENSRTSRAVVKAAMENTEREKVISQIVECHPQDSSEYEMSANLSRSSSDHSKQHRCRNARKEEVFPQSAECHSQNSSEDGTLSGSSSESQQQHHANARTDKLLQQSADCHSQNASEYGMSDGVTGSSQSQQHCREESISSVSGPLMMYSGAIPSFGSISFRSSSSTTSSQSFNFPILTSEWTGSPVRMGEGDRTQLRRHHRLWRIRFLCCSF